MRPAPRVDAREACAAVADVGVLVPIAAALAVVNGVDAGSELVFAGLLFVAAALLYRVPMPVQPIKAAAAIAIATGASPRVLAAAGLLIGAVLVALAATRAIQLVVRLFPKPIIRGNQLGVGLLLVLAAAGLAGRGQADPGAGLATWALLVVLLAAAGRFRGPLALAMVAGGCAWTLLWGGHLDLSPAVALPSLHLPRGADLAAALPLLVIPQLPLTLGNAIVGTADLERKYYGARAARVTEARLCWTSGLANVAAGLFGGMPLCHGSSGATAYHRFGARTGGVGLVIGAALLAAGLLFAPAALSLFSAIPGPVLAALLAYTGIRHALLVADLRGAPLAVALLMGVVGGLTRNLAWGMAVGLPATLALDGLRRRLGRPAAAAFQSGRPG